MGAGWMAPWCKVLSRVRSDLADYKTRPFILLLWLRCKGASFYCITTSITIVVLLFHNSCTVVSRVVCGYCMSRRLALPPRTLVTCYCCTVVVAVVRRYGRAR